MPLNIAAIQSHLQERQIDGWLIHDFRGSNSVLTLLLGKTHTTRRAMLFIPTRGQATIACSLLDRNAFEKLAAQHGLKVHLYISWREMHAWMASVLGACKRVAMEYAPGCTLPVVSIVDAGTIELVRSFGVEVVSSADVLQLTVAKWSAEALERHHKASSEVARIKDDAFAFIKHSLAAGNAINEYQVQQRIMQNFRDAGLEADEGPIVGVNEHGGDPHFEVSSTNPSPIKKGDWVLIDLWSRYPGEENIYSDITWVGYCGTDVPAKHRQVFEVVRAARDASVKCCQDAWAAKRPLQGWELDDAARLTIINAGFERGIRHRTGHSLSPGPRVHGLGFNLDNLETRETREVLPGLGFTIEPGIYLPDAPDRLGVRLEINMYIDAVKGPIITSCFQKEIVICG
jgi:Xaa-Pro aminopeptidase